MFMHDPKGAAEARRREADLKRDGEDVLDEDRAHAPGAPVEEDADTLRWRAIMAHRRAVDARVAEYDRKKKARNR